MEENNIEEKLIPIPPLVRETTYSRYMNDNEYAWDKLPISDTQKATILNELISEKKNNNPIDIIQDE